MLIYSLMLAKLALGLLCLIVQINLLGKGNLAPNSATDQVQNYVLGGIIGGVIYNNSISIPDFLLVLIAWTMLVLILKYLKSNSAVVKGFVDGRPAVLIERGKLMVEECMRHGLLAHDITLKLRMAGVYFIKDVKRAVLEPNGQLTVIQYGEQNARYPLILDGQIDDDALELIDKDRIWLNGELRVAGVELKDVYIGEYKDDALAVYPYESP
ncbi:DUF421 domain-containing protein [Selenomonas sp. oral taxon 138]|uniref:DUF421 domain-containing protein n=1 Tax=Selenomonas sp. oral taxon 138 TaxID=712532 RepID=UPI0002A41FC5|nr:DUF421 domain-containing protein [Selenomonas sp. oral taxon 138]EKX96995.1 hypothetical protein HMPREF9163_01521 [Selenomonas sp. oral taxon 138 str. F0429]